jgi:hypothetical protein
VRRAALESGGDRQSRSRRARLLSPQHRIDSYVRVTRLPRSLFVSEDGRIVGTWIMGNDYRVRTGFYGGYPAGYLRRMRALFPEKRKALHLCSGMVDLVTWPGDTVDVDEQHKPTYCCNAERLLGRVPLGSYDIVLADPPYSYEDAKRYGTPMIDRNAVIGQLAEGLSPGAHLVWLDQVLPMYRKTDWMLEGVIGMVKSTNHRFRVVTIFRGRGAQRGASLRERPRLSPRPSIPGRTEGPAKPCGCHQDGDPETGR